MKALIHHRTLPTCFPSDDDASRWHGFRRSFVCPFRMVRTRRIGGQAGRYPGSHSCRSRDCGGRPGQGCLGIGRCLRYCRALPGPSGRLPSGEVAGEPRLDYAQIEPEDRTLELVASSATGLVLVFEEGEAVQRSAPPIMSACLSSVFGRRNHPVLGDMRMHTGIDFAAATGSEDNATGSGRVVSAGMFRGYGLTADIDHGGGVVICYARLSRIAEGETPGRRVKAGDNLGAVGATGLVSGSNLHHEVRLDGAPVDPMDPGALPEEIIASVEDLASLERWRKATGFDTSRKEG